MRAFLLEPFQIDDGELSGITAEEAFVLGVEWQQFRAKLAERSDSFEEMVHARNAVRIAGMVSRTGRAVRVRSDNAGWAKIAVGAQTTN